MLNAGHSQTNPGGPTGRWPRPQPRAERVRPAAARERVQDRPVRLGIVVRPAAAGELQAEPEGAPGCGQVRQPAGQVFPGVADAGPDPRGSLARPGDW